MIESEQRVGVTDDDDPVRALRAWLTGDEYDGVPGAEAFDDPDGRFVRVAETLRRCVAGPEPCLAVESVRGVADLIAHTLTVHVPRLTPDSVRAFDALAVAVHTCNAKPSAQPPTMVAHQGAPVWAVEDSVGEVSRVIGWVTEIDYPAGYAEGPVYQVRAVHLRDGDPFADVDDIRNDDLEYGGVTLHWSEEEAYYRSRERRYAYDERNWQRLADRAAARAAAAAEEGAADA